MTKKKEPNKPKLNVEKQSFPFQGGVPTHLPKDAQVKTK